MYDGTFCLLYLLFSVLVALMKFADSYFLCLPYFLDFIPQFEALTGSLLRVSRIWFLLLNLIIAYGVQCLDLYRFQFALSRSVYRPCLDESLFICYI